MLSTSSELYYMTRHQLLQTRNAMNQCYELNNTLACVWNIYWLYYIKGCNLLWYKRRNTAMNLLLIKPVFTLCLFLRNQASICRFGENRQANILMLRPKFSKNKEHKRMARLPSLNTGARMARCIILLKDVLSVFRTGQLIVPGEKVLR
jgi:hypothetical protein